MGNPLTSTCRQAQKMWLLGTDRSAVYIFSKWGHYATSQKVAGSIPEGVIGIFHWLNPSSCTIALGLTQPVTGMSKGSQCAGLTTLPPLCADCLEIWEPQPPGILRACTGIALYTWYVMWILTKTVSEYVLFHLACSLTGSQYKMAPKLTRLWSGWSKVGILTGKKDFCLF